MKKEETKEFEALSLECFGMKYHYKKLMKQGLRYKDPHGVTRRQPLTKEGCRFYMEQTLVQRVEIQRDMEEKNETK